MADGIHASARNTQAREREQQLDLTIAGLLTGQRQCHQTCTLGLPSGQEGLPNSAVHVNIHCHECGCKDWERKAVRGVCQDTFFSPTLTSARLAPLVIACAGIAHAVPPGAAILLPVLAGLSKMPILL